MDLIHALKARKKLSHGLALTALFERHSVGCEVETIALIIAPALYPFNSCLIFEENKGGES